MMKVMTKYMMKMWGMKEDKTTGRMCPAGKKSANAELNRTIKPNEVRRAIKKLKKE